MLTHSEAMVSPGMRSQPNASAVADVAARMKALATIASISTSARASTSTNDITREHTAETIERFSGDVVPRMASSASFSSEKAVVALMTRMPPATSA